MAGYGESIRSVGVDYAGEAQSTSPDRGAAGARLSPAVVMARAQPVERTVRRCTVQAGRGDDGVALIGEPSWDVDGQRRIVMAVRSSSPFGAGARE